MSNSAKMSAKQRIEALVDENSFVEIGGLITKRNTDFNMQQKAVQPMVLLPVMVSLIPIWFMYTARM